ncbi:acyl-CoA thioesterase domain-containing protein [Sphingobium sp.]|uniref:acyl-CoA thioesterase n=1 Tax=Sphingobium sp. TaxID=1912891 RepID=UPI0028BE8F2E|nr:acyl-CoA thioesterase domain-containing protein [Sphingobium sp.]
MFLSHAYRRVQPLSANVGPVRAGKGIGRAGVRSIARRGQSTLWRVVQRSLPDRVRVPDRSGYLDPVADAKRHYWLRAPGAERVDDPAVQRQIFAFLSDFMFAGVPLSRHTVALPGPHLFVASLDHCIWFHRDMRCDDWLLFETEGPNAENGVNMARGLVYNRAGELVASLAQEALQYSVAEEGDPPG